ncbi:MAG TPA: amidohydrolase family protein [Acidimicrobiia bacterium]
MTVIDLHAHTIVPEALDRMRSSQPDFAPALYEESESKYLRYPGRAPLGPIPEGMFAPEQRLADMDRMRVDIQLISVPPPNFFYHLPAEGGSEFARIQNEALVALSDDHPDRFHVLATLPLQDVAASVEEIDRVALLPRVRGVEIGSNIAGTDLDDRYLEPVWGALEDRGLPVWIHPDQRSIAGAERLDVYYLQNLVGIPMESTIAIAKLIFGGVLQRHAGLRFGVTHGGGFAPYQVGRWQHGWEVRSEPRAEISEVTPRELFSRFYFDSLTHDPVSLRMLGERMGWDHVVLGSDYPFDMACADPVDAVESADIGQAAEIQVLERNAEVFLRPIGQAQ